MNVIRESGITHWLANMLAVGLLTAALAAAMVSSAAATTHEAAGAQRLIKDVTEELLVAIDRNYDAIRRDHRRAYEIAQTIISPHIDADRVARLVLGKHWNHATRVQRQRFREAYTAEIIRTIVDRMSDRVAASSDERARIRYLRPRSKANGWEATVRTRVASAGARPLKVDYRLRRNSDAWRLYDITIGGISLIAAHQRAYDAEIDRKGLDSLIRRLESRTPGAYRGHRFLGRPVGAGN